MKRISRVIVFLLVIISILSITACSVENADDLKTPKYIFYMIGDGFGFPHREFAQNLSMDVANDGLRLMEFDYNGSITTYAGNAKVTDSAAAATALSTGVKTDNKRIGQNSEGEDLVTVMEYARDELDYSIGLVTTTKITHATPACFVANNENRNNEDEIALDILNADIDFIAGGGISFFMPVTMLLEQDSTGRKTNSMRTDELDLIAEFEDAGYNTMIGQDGAYEIMNYKPIEGEKVFAGLAQGYMPYELERLSNDKDISPTLAQMTDAAIKNLSASDDGFMLMVEGGRIDHASHDNTSTKMIFEALAYDEAIGVVWDFYLKHKNETLIVLVSDHETGGLRLNLNKKEYPTDELIDIYDGDRNAFYDYLASKYYLTELRAKEIEILEAAMDRVDSEEYTLLYDRYDPLESAVIQLLALREPVDWTSGNHTDALVPISAQGVNAELFEGFMDNTDIANLIFDMLGRE